MLTLKKRKQLTEFTTIQIDAGTVVGVTNQHLGFTLATNLTTPARRWAKGHHLHGWRFTHNNLPCWIPFRLGKKV